MVSTVDDTPSPAEVTVPNSRTIDFTSSVNGRAFRLAIGLPEVPPPSQGYRTLWVLDGNWYFLSALEAVRRNFNAPDVVVVAIGYPETLKFIAQSQDQHGPPAPHEATVAPFLLACLRERLFDLTMPMSEAHLAEMAFAPGTPRHPSMTGGVDALLETMERDVMPRVTALVKIDQDGAALFGHSGGGFAAVRALFTRPRMFRTFVAASPALRLSDYAVLEDEAKFAELVRQGKVAPRILVTMGAQEDRLPINVPFTINPEALAAAPPNSTSIDDARSLVGRLRALEGAAGYEVADYALFEGQDHCTSPWSAIARTVQFAFK